jgi:Family of unknown function (DUF6232)
MSANQSRYIDTLHYHHHGIVVTSRYFTVGTLRVRVDELSGLAQSQGRAHPAIAVGAAVAVADLVLVVPLLILQGAVLALLLALPVFVGACLVSLVSAHRWPVRRELMARHRGRLVTLFATNDEHQFGQVSRALLRAVENADSRDGFGRG